MSSLALTIKPVSARKKKIEMKWRPINLKHRLQILDSSIPSLSKVSNEQRKNFRLGKVKNIRSLGELNK
jgi:hypothetical protein